VNHKGFGRTKHSRRFERTAIVAYFSRTPSPQRRRKAIDDFLDARRQLPLPFTSEPAHA